MTVLMYTEMTLHGEAFPTFTTIYKASLLYESVDVQLSLFFLVNPFPHSLYIYGFWEI